MTHIVLRYCALLIVCLVVYQADADGYAVISAENIANLRATASIDFADLPGEHEIGWFESNADASEMLVFDRDSRLYRVGASGRQGVMRYGAAGAPVLSVIDAAYAAGEPHVLYFMDGAFYIGGRQMPAELRPVALHAVGDSLYVEVYFSDGGTMFLPILAGAGVDGLSPHAGIALPAPSGDSPAVRIGRIDFPHVLISSLKDKTLALYRYPEAFNADAAQTFTLSGGPAVAGAINRSGTHLVWSGPEGARLNVLDMANGENQIVADLVQFYAQYYLLSHDASVIVLVNLDFAPAVYAWEVETGRRHDLGPYRQCGRIPDKVALSADGTALTIGCDTGIEIWRITEEQEE